MQTHQWRQQMELSELFPFRCIINLKGGHNHEFVCWCTEQFGENYLGVHWITFKSPEGRDWGYFAEEFYFNQVDDALLFKLRFGGIILER